MTGVRGRCDIQRAVIGLVIAPAFLLAPCAASAQAPAGTTSSDANHDAGFGADIVVTAEKRSNLASRVPISINAFSGDQLKQLNITQTSDLARIVPGFTFAKSEQNTPIYTIRGVGFRTPNLSSTSPVGIYLDEVGYPYPYMAQGLDLDVARVEVLKGPQGTLFGRNTTAGLINYITNRPTDHFGAGVNLTAGSYQSYGGDGYINVPVAPGFSARFAARVERSDKGWQKSVTRDDRLGKVDRFQGRGMLRWQGGSGTDVLLTGSYWSDKSDTQAPQIVALQEGAPGLSDPRILPSIVPLHSATQADWPSDAARAANAPAFTVPRYKVDAHFRGLSLRIDQPVSDNIVLTSLSGYNHVKRGDVSPLAGAGLLTLGEAQQDGRITDLSTELRLAGTTDTLSWIAGASYTHDKVLDNSLTFIPNNSQSVPIRLAFLFNAFPNSFTPAQIAGFYNQADLRLRYTARNSAVFGNVEWKALPSLTAAGGLRYTKYNARAVSCTADVNNSLASADNILFAALLGVQAGLTPNNCITLAADPVTGVALPSPPGGLQHHQKDNNLSGHGVLTWKPGAGTIVYGSYSRGYNVGQFPIVSVSLARGLDPVKPETIDAFELGLKTHGITKTLQLNVAGYYYLYHDKQSFNKFLDPVFGPNPTIINVPQSRIWGIDGEAVWNPTSDFGFRLGANYMRTRIDKFVGYTELATLQDFKGNQLTFSPKLQLSGSVNGRHPVSDTLDVTGLATISYQSKSFSSLDNDPRYQTKAYATVDADISLAAHQGAWSVHLFAKNLFNEYYWTSQVYAADTLVRYAGRPRTFGVRLGYEFN